jgi:hypothetical protein
MNLSLVGSFYDFHYEKMGFLNYNDHLQLITIQRIYMNVGVIEQSSMNGNKCNSLYVKSYTYAT